MLKQLKMKAYQQLIFSNTIFLSVYKFKLYIFLEITYKW